MSRAACVDADVTRHRSWALAPALLLLCACQHVPSLPIDSTLNAERLAARSLSAPAVGQALARQHLSIGANEPWSLDQLTLAAWTLRTDVQVARLDVAAAYAATGVEGQGPNPSVSTTTEKVVDAGVAEPWVIGAALALTLEPGGKRSIRRERALANEQVAELRFGESLWSARAQVRAALLDLSLTNEIATLDADEARLRHRFLDWVDTRLRYGAATTPERLAAVQAVNESDSRRELDVAAAAKAAATLAAAAGVAPAELTPAQVLFPSMTTLPALSGEGMTDARNLAMMNRLDVRRALGEYAIAEADLRAAVASQYPDITLAPGYTVDQDTHKITLGLGLPVPLFHDASAAITRAIAARATAAAKFSDVQSSAMAAIDIAFAQYEASRNALAAAERAERDAAAATTAIERQLAAGAVSRGESLAQQLTLVGLRRATLVARRAAIDALTALENGIERPLFPSSAIEPAGVLRELLAESPQ